MEEVAEKKAVVFRLFGVEVHGEAAAAEEEDEERFMELKKSTSMPNLTSIAPLLLPGEASNDKGYASDDEGHGSTPQLKRRRRKAHERKKGKLASLFRSQTHGLFSLSCIVQLLLFYSFIHVPITVIYKLI
jgi:hypothetical protein